MSHGSTPAVEVELKMQVPPDRLGDVIETLERLEGGVESHHLEAHYLDTPAFDLSAAGLAWRLRLEDGEWVQTLKARAAGTAFGRFEHNVRRSATPDGTPAPDASLHAGSDVGERLIDIVRTVDEPVGVRYRTQIERMTATQTTADGGEVELALDSGVIVADGRRIEVRELEVELVHGTASDVVDVAIGWVGSMGLRPDSFNKAYRGMLLARDITAVPVRRAEVTNVATLTAAIRANYSAVINGLGGAAHTHAVGDDLRRVARLLDADRAHRYDAVGDAVRTLGAQPDATHDDCVGILSDLTVTTAVTELLGLLD